ncbi:protein kinase [Nocardia sp. NPDC052566]|uniref:serine/threonine protein kinase n=1 Tax=Nocardia sp. NPDC052566 TaxID=3364330 RepID=UPI0037CAC317
MEAALGAGAMFAGYRIERVLGQGGMGTVYLAAHPRLPRSIALKLLGRELYADDELRLRFEREADVAARLDHPNIVAVYDRGVEDHQLWISMQYVDGSDAAEFRGASMDPARAVRIVGQTADALDYAHERGVLHRDVKPANILLTPVRGGDRVLLSDFGIARLRDETHGLTKTGTFVATLAYASPEQLSGHPLDHRADQYALGATLFALLTGQTPFAATNPGTIVTAHLQRPVPSASAAAPGLPAAIDAVIAKAMAKRPDARFTSCAEFADAAAEALADRRTAPTQQAARPMIAEHEMPLNADSQQHATRGRHRAPSGPVPESNPAASPGQQFASTGGPVDQFHSPGSGRPHIPVGPSGQPFSPAGVHGQHFTTAGSQGQRFSPAGAAPGQQVGDVGAPGQQFVPQGSTGQQIGVVGAPGQQFVPQGPAAGQQVGPVGALGQQFVLPGSASGRQHTATAVPDRQYAAVGSVSGQQFAPGAAGTPPAAAPHSGRQRSPRERKIRRRRAIAAAIAVFGFVVVIVAAREGGTPLAPAADPGQPSPPAPAAPWGASQSIADAFPELIPGSPEETGWRGASCGEVAPITGPTDPPPTHQLACTDRDGVQVRYSEFAAAGDIDGYLAVEVDELADSGSRAVEGGRLLVYQAPDHATFPLLTRVRNSTRGRILIEVSWPSHTFEDIYQQWWHPAPF